MDLFEEMLEETAAVKATEKSPVRETSRHRKTSSPKRQARHSSPDRMTVKSVPMIHKSPVRQASVEPDEVGSPPLMETQLYNDDPEGHWYGKGILEHDSLVAC